MLSGSPASGRLRSSGNCPTTSATVCVVAAPNAEMSDHDGHVVLPAPRKDARQDDHWSGKQLEALRLARCCRPKKSSIVCRSPAAAEPEASAQLVKFRCKRPEDPTTRLSGPRVPVQ